MFQKEMAKSGGVSVPERLRFDGKEEQGVTNVQVDFVTINLLFAEAEVR